jgi:hypothetical protein
LWVTKQEYIEGKRAKEDRKDNQEASQIDKGPGLKIIMIPIFKNIFTAFFGLTLRLGSVSLELIFIP